MSGLGKVADASIRGGVPVGIGPKLRMVSNSYLVLLGRVGTLLLQVASALVLARLLTPEEFGIFSVAAAGVGLLQGLRDFGAANYIVRAPRADKQTVGSALSVSGLISIALGMVVWLSADPLANFYGNGEVAPIVRLLALNFFIAPVVMLGSALLTRAERFATRVVIELVSVFTSSVVSVVAAMAGGGAMALAVGTTAHSIMAVLAYAWVRPEGFRLVPCLRGASKVFRFGGWLAGINISNQIAERGVDLLVGKTLGFAALGFFDKGSAAVRMVSDLFGTVLHSVIFAAAARESREGTDSGSRYIDRLMVITAVLWPLLGFLAINAEPVVVFLFGDQWEPAVPVAQALAVSGMIVFPVLLGDQALIIKGYERSVFFYKLRFGLARIAAVLLTAPLGLVGVAWSLVLAGVYQAWLQQKLVGMILHLPQGWILRALGPGGRLTCVVVGLGVGVPNLLLEGSAPQWLWLWWSGLAAACGWVLGTYIEGSLVGNLRKELFGIIGAGVGFRFCRGEGALSGRRPGPAEGPGGGRATKS